MLKKGNAIKIFINIFLNFMKNANKYLPKKKE